MSGYIVLHKFLHKFVVPFKIMFTDKDMAMFMHCQAIEIKRFPLCNNIQNGNQT